MAKYQQRGCHEVSQARSLSSRGRSFVAHCVYLRRRSVVGGDSCRGTAANPRLRSCRRSERFDPCITKMNASRGAGTCGSSWSESTVSVSVLRSAKPGASQLWQLFYVELRSSAEWLLVAVTGCNRAAAVPQPCRCQVPTLILGKIGPT
jgi:hypothetical protein